MKLLDLFRAHDRHNGREPGEGHTFVRKATDSWPPMRFRHDLVVHVHSSDFTVTGDEATLQMGLFMRTPNGDDQYAEAEVTVPIEFLETYDVEAEKEAAALAALNAEKDTNAGLGHKREGPHSRACGPQPHPHGQFCSTNCPTCGGWA